MKHFFTTTIWARLSKKRFFIILFTVFLLTLLLFAISVHLSQRALHVPYFIEVFFSFTVALLFFSAKHQSKGKNFLKSDISAGIATLSMGSIILIDILEAFSTSSYYYSITDLLIILFVLALACLTLFRSRQISG
ncbi:hypothetical protein KDA_72680 [Dictyobacter alpinus]|uniref:Uncharacterized protein n=1 Tax=Dictyobacter alpinus TaxID=2014873 RepID=A0A402BKB4_9CHLR|nr:hypothetical protein [Dictyobacter alpinus]GCE31784.1 hypothetical protein KDA_72680 [Dictyobacter alpinus]